MIRCIKFANSPLERIGLLICLVDYKIHRDTSDCPQTHPYASLSAPRPTCQTNAVYCLNTVSSVWRDSTEQLTGSLKPLVTLSWLSLGFSLIRMNSRPAWSVYHHPDPVVWLMVQILVWNHSVSHHFSWVWLWREKTKLISLRKETSVSLEASLMGH